ncbi:septal ring lytic transglycosylase RlpA family protein [Arachnia propionica]|nr:septal ring lytic transglycosylase RlpA family protein [Arachnia propionica]
MSMIDHVRRFCVVAGLTAVLSVPAPAVFPTTTAVAAAGDTVTARVNVNIRSGPGTSHPRLGLLRAGQTLQARGSAVNGWVPVSHRGRDAWVSAPHVRTSPATAPVPADATAIGQARTTTRLNVRPQPSTSNRPLTVLAKGATVGTTGVVSGTWTQIVWRSGTAWVASRYLASGGSAPVPAPDPVVSPTPTPAPATTGSRWATTELNLWVSATGSRYRGTVPKGTELRITGTVSRGRAQVVWRGTTRWVTARYLSETAPGTVPTGTQSCLASFYGDDTATASGEPFDRWAMKTAHRSLPFGTRLRVTNPSNGKSVVVTVNDRGPYVAGRCLDLTTGAFREIADLEQGVIKVNFEIVR